MTTPNQRMILSPDEAELWALLDRLPHVAAPLLEMIRQGRIFGRSYWPVMVLGRECCCLYGWIAALAGYRSAHHALDSRQVLRIMELNREQDTRASDLEWAILDATTGDTPATHAGLATVERLILAWFAASEVAI